MKKFSVDDIISAEEIQFYRSYVGIPWEATQEQEAAKEQIKLIWDKLYLLGEYIVKKSLGDEFYVLEKFRKCLDQAGGKAGPRKFRHYLLVRIKHKSNEFKDEIYYWLSAGFERDERSKIINKDQFRITLGLGVPDEKTPENIKNHFEKIADEQSLRCRTENVENRTIAQIGDVLLHELSNSKKTFNQIVIENKIELQEYKNKIANRIKQRNGARQETDGGSANDIVDEDASATADPAKSVIRAENIIYYGPPGTGKTFRLQALQKEKFPSRCVFVTFHQSYGYEEFVEGLRPVLIGDAHSDKNSSDGQDVKYKIEPGIFKKLCDRARLDPDNGYAIFIDEINRGNISKIFGELITLIELDKRSNPESEQEQQFQVSLAYSKEPFTVPANVSIIGSMNTADRSLALIDTALRRRFEFKDLYPDTRETKDDNDKSSAPLAGLMVGSIDVRRMLECINERIEVLYDRDHCIGHAYFTGLVNKDESIDTDNKFDKFKNIFFNRIKPLLEEYFFDDWEKIGRVLGDHLKKESTPQLQFLNKLSPPKDLRNSDDISDDSKIFLRPRYRWNDNAFSVPEAYIGIYSQS